MGLWRVGAFLDSSAEVPLDLALVLFPQEDGELARRWFDQPLESGDWSAFFYMFLTDGNIVIER